MIVLFLKHPDSAAFAKGVDLSFQEMQSKRTHSNPYRSNNSGSYFPCVNIRLQREMAFLRILIPIERYFLMLLIFNV